MAYYNWFWTGIKYDIPLCCIMFFETPYTDGIKKNIPEYGNSMCELTNNEGIILCPDCLIKKLNTR